MRVSFRDDGPGVESLVAAAPRVGPRDPLSLLVVRFGTTDDRAVDLVALHIAAERDVLPVVDALQLVDDPTRPTSGDAVVERMAQSLAEHVARHAATVLILPDDDALALAVVERSLSTHPSWWTHRPVGVVTLTTPSSASYVRRTGVLFVLREHGLMTFSCEAQLRGHSADAELILDFHPGRFLRNVAWVARAFERGRELPILSPAGA